MRAVCTGPRDPRSSRSLSDKRPELIVRATALAEQDSQIEFTVNEALRGKSPALLRLPGSVAATDDFNDKPSPYKFVRPDGRGGSCFARSYRLGAQYLLFLVRSDRGAYTVNWAPLAPVNEQLHSTSDPWLLWVRKQLSYSPAH